MDIRESMGRLNERQREAVEHVDGPLLVVAGPGTGKTELLSLRAAQILSTRDVGPENVLCLTYTDSGADAMRRRLVSLLGRDAYGVEVATFHSFASSVRARYPEFFRSDPSAAVVSDLHAKEIIDTYLKGLPYGSPLSATHGGVSSALGDVAAFIGWMKRNGLTPGECRQVMLQNIEAADYLDGCDELVTHVRLNIPRRIADMAAFTERFAELIHEACASAPESLRRAVVKTTGVYVPYLAWLDALVARTKLFDGRSTKGYQDVRDSQFKKGDDGLRRASVRGVAESALSAVGAYEHYQRTLEAEGLFDYDDMVMDCLEAIESSPTLRHALKDRYRYIQVDEFQDTNGAQMSLVELLCEGDARPNVMAVGDDDQAIMRFQGASVAHVEQFQERFRPHVVVLQVNYRSTPEVVELGTGIARQIERRLPATAHGKDIRAHRDSEGAGHIREVTFPTAELQYQAVARDIRERIDEGFMVSCADADEAIAVIAARHASLRALIPYLVAERVPFDYKVKTNALEMESMQALLATLRCVVALSQGRLEVAESFLPQVVCAPEFGGDHVSSVAFALTARREHGGRWMDALAASGDPRLRGLRERIMGWAARAHSAPVRALMFDIAAATLAYHRARRAADPYAFAELNAGIREVLRFAEGELGTAARLGRTMRLPDVVERLDSAERFGIDLDASVAVGMPGAVRLTTAHGSKGLEFDLVYLLDADDGTWHRTRRSSGLYPANLLVGDDRDADDARRLLFVAATRARTWLEVCRGAGDMLRELRGADGGGDLIESAEGTFDEADLADAILTDWRQSYALDTPELASLLGDRPLRHLSASTLNAFVSYEDGSPACARFPVERLLRLPEAPSTALEFGSVVHAYLEDYVAHVVRDHAADPMEVTGRWRAAVEALDFDAEDVARLIVRFDRVSSAFAAWAARRLVGRVETEVALSAVVGDGVPLFGKCDLLLVDDEARTVRVVDYKTGQGYPEGRPDPAYERQLRFYRLLVENSAQFEGFRVVACENWYVEPEQKTGVMREPVVASVTDTDVERLVPLIEAVWNRVSRSDYDTSGFEDSELKAEALRRGRNKKERARALQEAYERWLVEDDVRTRMPSVGAGIDGAAG